MRVPCIKYRSEGHRLTKEYRLYVLDMSTVELEWLRLVSSTTGMKMIEFVRMALDDALSDDLMEWVKRLREEHGAYYVMSMLAQKRRYKLRMHPRHMESLRKATYELVATQAWKPRAPGIISLLTRALAVKLGLQLRDLGSKTGTERYFVSTPGWLYDRMVESLRYAYNTPSGIIHTWLRHPTDMEDLEVLHFKKENQVIVDFRFTKSTDDLIRKFAKQHECRISDCILSALYKATTEVLSRVAPEQARHSPELVS